MTTTIAMGIGTVVAMSGRGELMLKPQKAAGGADQTRASPVWAIFLVRL